MSQTFYLGPRFYFMLCRKKSFENIPKVTHGYAAHPGHGDMEHGYSFSTGRYENFLNSARGHYKRHKDPPPIKDPLFA